MNNYLLFGGAIWYAEGGANDFIGSFEIEQTAVDAGIAQKEDEKFEWWHIYSLKDGKIVQKSEENPFSTK
jgi:hypothetical protein